MVSMHEVHEHPDQGGDQQVEGDKYSGDYCSSKDMEFEGVEQIVKECVFAGSIFMFDVFK